MSHIVKVLKVVVLTISSTLPLAAQTIGLPPYKAAMSEQDARFPKWRVQAPAGSGPYAAERIIDPSISTHTRYAPKDLSQVPGLLPILSFGNGGCRNTSIEFTAFLSEIASRGFFVILREA